MENIKMLNSHKYIVWTQAGFKKACKTLQTIMDDHDPVEGYPKKYPSYVEFSGGYAGYHYWYASCSPLTDTIKYFKSLYEVLETADKEHNLTKENNDY